MITHVVLFKLKDNSPERVAITAGILRAMEGQIEQLKSIEVGLDVIHSERSYDIALITRFDSMEALGEYQVHPVHQKVIEHIAQVRESVISVDFESK